MHSQSCRFCLSATNTSPVPQCRSLNSKRGDVTTEAVSPPKGAGSAYLPAPEKPVGMCSTVIAGLGNSCLSNTTFFLWIGQTQVSSQDSSFPWLCSCSSASGRGGLTHSVPAQVRGWQGQGVELSLLPLWLQLSRHCPARALSLAVTAGAHSAVCQQTPAPSGSTQFSMGSCRDNPRSLWLGWEQARTRNCCEHGKRGYCAAGC